MKKAVGTLAALALVVGISLPAFALDSRMDAAGDLCLAGSPSSCAASGTLARSRGANVVISLGDNQYDHGTLTEYNAAFDKTDWGALYKTDGLLRPVPGNHEWLDTNANGYRNYFATATNLFQQTNGNLWYTRTDNNVRYYYLDSTVCTNSSTCNVGGAEYNWLQNSLANVNTKECIVVSDHHPRWSSGTSHGSTTELSALWTMLASDPGGRQVDLFLSGHEHNYERFNLKAGIRQVIAGTGNTPGDNFGSPIAGSVVRINNDPGDTNSTLTSTATGVLEFNFANVLATGGTYAAQFLEIDNGDAGTAPQVLDTFSGTC